MKFFLIASYLENFSLTDHIPFQAKSHEDAIGLLEDIVKHVKETCTSRAYTKTWFVCEYDPLKVDPLKLGIDDSYKVLYANAIHKLEIPSTWTPANAHDLTNILRGL